jgi:plasmid stabilization system protein ParE
VTFRVRFTREAEDDLVRLYEFILERDPTDWQLAERPLAALRHAVVGLERSAFSYRKALGANDPLLRELVIPFGATACVALFEVESNDLVTVLAVRHQREDDYY